MNQTELKRKVKLTPKKFKLWLDTFTLREEVGIQISSCNCPIARYLKRQGLSGVVVSTDQIRWKEQHIPAHILSPIPTWVRKFIQSIDSIHFHSGRISKQRALKVLKQINAL